MHEIQFVLRIKPKICHPFVLFNRYRQILEKALQLTGAEQLEALKAFVEASEYCSESALCSTTRKDCPLHDVSL